MDMIIGQSRVTGIIPAGRVGLGRIVAIRVG